MVRVHLSSLLRLVVLSCLLVVFRAGVSSAQPPEKPVSKPRVGVSGGLAPRLLNLFSGSRPLTPNTPAPITAPGITATSNLVPVGETAPQAQTDLPAAQLAPVSQEPVIFPIPPRPVSQLPEQVPAPEVSQPAQRMPAPLSVTPTGTPEQLPPPRPSSPNNPSAPPGTGTPHATPKVVPINLDTVLRLANDQNGQIALAREKINEAYAQRDVACKCWLPTLEIGPSYWRHEGGIQDFNGRLIHSSYGGLFAGMEILGRFNVQEAVYHTVKAEQEIWQRKGEASKMTSEKLLEASSTYIELLTLRTLEAISVDLEAKIKKVRDQAQKIAETEPGKKAEVAFIDAALTAQRAYTREIQEGARVATARLLYLLGLDPCAELQVMDSQMVAIRLVDDQAPVETLVAQALATGPGIRELEGMLSLLNDSIARSQGPGRLMPVVEVRLAEGAFGAGPGSKLDWDNRFDICLNARWNLTALASANDRLRAANSQLHQTEISYQDLRARLTKEVQAAREVSLSATERAKLGETGIEQARDAYRRSEDRLGNFPDAKHTDVLKGIEALGKAQIAYLQALRDFNQAQLRLLIFTGKVGGH